MAAQSGGAISMPVQTVAEISMVALLGVACYVDHTRVEIIIDS